MFDYVGPAEMDKLMRGGKVSISPASIQNNIISLQDAKKALPEDEFQQFYNTFIDFQNKHKSKMRMSYSDYNHWCFEIIGWVEKFVPYPIVSGGAGTYEIQEFRKKRENERSGMTSAPASKPQTQPQPERQPEKVIKMTTVPIEHEDKPAQNFCPSCGALLQAGSLFCHKCGRGVEPAVDITDGKTCQRCGYRIARDAKYCPVCGTEQNASRPVITEEELKAHRNDYKSLMDLLKSDPMSLHFSDEECGKVADMYTYYRYVGKNHFLKAIDEYASGLTSDDFDQKMKLSFVLGAMQADGLLKEDEVQELNEHLSPLGWKPLEIDENALQTEAAKRQAFLARSQQQTQAPAPAANPVSQPAQSTEKKSRLTKVITSAALAVILADVGVSLLINKHVGFSQFWLPIGMAACVYFVTVVIISLVTNKKLTRFYPGGSILKAIVGVVILEASLLTLFYSLNGLQIVNYSKNIREMPNGEYMYQALLSPEGGEPYIVPDLIEKKDNDYYSKTIYLNNGIITEEIFIGPSLKIKKMTRSVRDKQTKETMGVSITFDMAIQEGFASVSGVKPKGPDQKMLFWAMLPAVTGTIVVQLLALLKKS